MDVKNNALMNNPELASEFAKQLPVAGDLETAEETAASSGKPLPKGFQSSDRPSATKAPYDFKREKARRKAAARSRKINRRK